MAPTCGRPSTHRPIITAKPVSPFMKSRVPVDGVHHPHPAVAEARAVVGQLLGEDGVVREGLAQALHDERVGGVIGLGHRLVAGLALDVQGLAQ
jgi:hypothetical protein